MSKPANQLLQEFSTISKSGKHTVEPDLGRCCGFDCGKVSKIEDFIEDYGYHDGWEMPPYTELLCPHCDDGALEDCFYSDAQWKLYLEEEYKDD